MGHGISPPPPPPSPQLNKCSCLILSRARKPKIYKYILKCVTLAEESWTKYLGVDIQSNLAWNYNHIDQVTNKSNNMLGFLRRKLRSASTETKTGTLISRWYGPTLNTVPQHGIHISQNICII